MGFFHNLQLFASARAASSKFLSIDGLNHFLTKINGKFAGKSAVRTATLTAAGWTGTDIFTNTISVQGVLPATNVEVLVADSATTDQKMAWAEAGILSGTTNSGSITLRAYGEKPTTDIPLTLIIRGD